ncbi:patatin-like phospholipase family protein [Nocardia puris]|uniref:patatin-like phospholipase family protein n=1 Tax=Nocardia puris TaxID=208602 RepID=UPI0018941CE5|nr:patatin-like phospholipase family protein [Nocardia puris]MBF6212149.1 patatin-like phospholipase family protein [Nocardia puris]
MVAASVGAEGVSGAPRIGLALSGGGFRATAFGLGCLRALADRDLLRRVRVVSGISGGSLLAAMWAYGPQEFEEFEASVIALLRSGLQIELARRTFAPAAVVRNVGSVGRTLVSNRARSHSRTDSLVDALGARPFGQRLLGDVTHPDMATVLSATDMASGNAVRFGSRVSSCSAYGVISTAVPVAEAVAASAAFPVLLPALTRSYEFRDRRGEVSDRQLVMTDGGVYDNLGLSPLLPGRSAHHSDHVYDLDYLIAVDAGRGRATRGEARYLPLRMKQTFDITYGKTQDAARTRIHLAGESGHIKGFVHTYLGMSDAKLPVPVHDLVAREQVERYPTNFAKMAWPEIHAITVRGEQLTRVLLGHYCPSLC